MSSATYDLHALIEEARRRARQRRWAYAGVLALLAGAGIWGGVALSGGSGAIPAPPAPPGYHLVKARGDVQHALIAGWFRSGVGGEPQGKQSKERVEVWLDRKAGLIRTRGCSFGSCVDEAARCVPACASSEPLLERYWPVDTTKFVRRPGLGSFRGRQVIWLGKFENTFPPAFANGEWIALDPRTHDPVGGRTYSNTGQIFSERWVVRRFPEVAPNRLWFAVKNKFDARIVRLQPIPLYAPGKPVPDMPQATRVIVGRLAGATIFASVRRDGSWRFFSVSRDGRVNGHSRIDDPHTLRAALVVRHGTLFTGRAYLVVAGSMFARRDTKLFAVFANGSRQRIKLIATGNPAGPTAFHYYRIAKAHQVRGRPVTSFQLLRGSRVLAGQIWPFAYQAPEGPAPVPLRAALRAFDS